jgi:hypothetical protein
MSFQDYEEDAKFRIEQQQDEVKKARLVKEAEEANREKKNSKNETYPLLPALFVLRNKFGV